MLQFRPNRSQEFYAPSRDILGFFRPLYLETLNIVRERNNLKTDEVDKLEMLMNGLINEATAGVRKLEMHEIIGQWQEALKQVDEDIADEFCRLFVSAIVFRYVLGKREVPEDQVKSEDLGKVFSGLYLLSVLPEDMASVVKHHVLAYNHIPKIAIENEPPCVVEEAKDENE